MSREDVMQVPPPELNIDILTSASSFVKNRRMVEIMPDSQSNYGSLTSNYRATFNIGATGNEFLDTMNSYFRCNLMVSSGVSAEKPVLDVGGINALIKSLTIQTKNGVRIEYIDNYNKLHAMLRCATMNEDNVESVQSFECGDSMADLPYVDNHKLLVDTSTNKFGITGLADFKDFNVVEPARSIFNGNAGGPTLARAFTFKLTSDFFSHLKYLPLPMLKSLQVIFEFERPGLGFYLVDSAGPGAQLTATMNYEISNFRYVASYVEVNDEVLAQYESAYNSDSGLSLSYLTHRNFRYSLSGGGNFEVQFSANSCRYLLIAIMPNESFSESGEFKGLPCQSTFLKSALTSYRVQSGGKVFPANAPIRTDTPYASEAFTQLMIALNQHQNKLCNTSIRVWEWRDDVAKTISRTNTASALTITDSTKFIIGVDLTDVDTFSGLNTYGNNLLVDLQFDTVPAHNLARNACVFVAVDSVLSLQKNLGVIVRN